tara:strand:+ start:204 stop:461 length:258 start_codon:yes stop_codon:yes gene_type:complete
MTAIDLFIMALMGVALWVFIRNRIILQPLVTKTGPGLVVHIGHGGLHRRGIQADHPGAEVTGWRQPVTFDEYYRPPADGEGLTNE